MQERGAGGGQGWQGGGLSPSREAMAAARQVNRFAVRRCSAADISRATYRRLQPQTKLAVPVAARQEPCNHVCARQDRIAGSSCRLQRKGTVGRCLKLEHSKPISSAAGVHFCTSALEHSASHASPAAGAYSTSALLTCPHACACCRARVQWAGSFQSLRAANHKRHQQQALTAPAHWVPPAAVLLGYQQQAVPGAVAQQQR